MLGFGKASGRIVTADTANGSLEADAFLLAAGARSAALARQAGFRLPIQPCKGYSITIERPQAQLEHPVYLGQAKVGISLYQNAFGSPVRWRFPDCPRLWISGA